MRWHFENIFISEKRKKKEKKKYFLKYIKSKAYFTHIKRNYVFQFKWNIMYINKKKKISHMTHASLSFESLSLCTYLSMTLYFRKFCLTLIFIHIKRRKLNSYVQIDLINAIPIKHLFDLNSVSIINPISLKHLLAYK